MRSGWRQPAWLFSSANRLSDHNSMKHFQKINRLSMILCLGVVHILTFAVSARCETPSELLRLRRGVHKTNVVAFTRLVFDLKGERPTGIASVAPDKWSISFRELRSKLDPEILMADPASTVTAVRIQDAAQGSQVVVQFRAPDCVVTHSYLPPETPAPGAYRLMVDILPPVKQKTGNGKTKDAKVAVNRGERPTESAKADVVSIQPMILDASGKVLKAVGNPAEKPKDPAKANLATDNKELEKPHYREVAEADLSEPLKHANRLFAQKSYDQAFTEYSRHLKDPRLSGDELSLALYGLADTYFFMQEALATSANEITTNYANALKVDPSLVQAAWAYYRSGLAYQASGDQENAIKSFQKAIDEYPKHPASALCRLELAASYQKIASHAQAVRAARSALESPLDQPLKTRAYWLLGSSLHATGEYIPATEALEQCLTQDPRWYREQPLLLKYLGESFFFQRQYDKSREYLLWYLNLQPKAPDKGLILAKIAEIFSAEDDPDYANKLYDHIGSNYPNSDGDVIAQIRKADLSKNRGKVSQEDDLNLFRELAQKPLSPQLLKLVHLKLASREHEYGNFDESVSVIDYNLHGNATAISNNDFVILRSKVVQDWMKSAHQNRDYRTVIQLYEKGQSTSTNANTAEINLLVADSYAGVKQYHKAITLYEHILANKGAVEEGDVFARMAEATLQAKDLERAAKYCSQIQGTQFEQKKMVLWAQIYFAQHHYSKVVECLGSLPEQDVPATSNPSIYSIFGESLSHLGECEKAARWLQKTSEHMEQTGSHSDELLHCYMVQAACYTKSEKHDKAITVLEEASTIAGSENLRDQLNYDISKLYLQLGQIDKAIQRLTGLMKSPKSFWQTAAKQQLEYIQMERK